MGEASKHKRSTNWLRPDCHIDKDKKFEDMSYFELVHGMHEVNKCIERAKIPGITAEGYAQHMSFVTLKGQSGAFPPIALALYDHLIVSKVIDNSPRGLCKWRQGRYREIPQYGTHDSSP